MNFESAFPIIAQCITDDAPVEAFYQARDIFEMILVATEKSGLLLDQSDLSDDDVDFVHRLLVKCRISDAPSFHSLLGCADLLLNDFSSSRSNLQRLFHIMMVVLGAGSFNR